jgi:hypothetical protein
VQEKEEGKHSERKREILMHKGRYLVSNGIGTQKKTKKCENALVSSECNRLDGHAK